MLEVPEALLAERRSLGLDHKDEMWEGVLHMVPPASERHQRLEAEILVALHPVVTAKGLTITTDTGVFLADDSYRVPDLVVASETHRSERGVEVGAELVIEIASPGDESYAKLPFYREAGVGEVLIIDRDTCAVRHWSGRPVLDERETEANGSHLVESLGLLLIGLEGHLTWTAVD